MSIDLTKYEGHASAEEWNAFVRSKNTPVLTNFGLDGKVDVVGVWLVVGPDRELLADSPKLLAEVKRLRADLAEATDALQYAIGQADAWFDDSWGGQLETRQMDSARAVLAKHKKA